MWRSSAACHRLADLPVVCSDLQSLCGCWWVRPRCCTRRGDQTDTRSAPAASGRCTSPPSQGRRRPHWPHPLVRGAAMGPEPPSSPLTPGRGSPTWTPAGCTHTHAHTHKVGIGMRKEITKTTACNRSHNRNKHMRSSDGQARTHTFKQWHRLKNHNRNSTEVK